jgi:hypothetical protein
LPSFLLNNASLHWPPLLPTAAKSRHSNMRGYNRCSWGRAEAIRLFTLQLRSVDMYVFGAHPCFREKCQ